jgi:hypothetical protein
MGCVLQVNLSSWPEVEQGLLCQMGECLGYLNTVGTAVKVVKPECGERRHR